MSVSNPKAGIFRSAAFLDRDGVLNVDTGYVHDPQTATLVPGAIEAARRLKSAGYLLVVVSNQSGVARGYFDEQTVQDFNTWLNGHFEEGNAGIDAFYYCPYHPEQGSRKYRVDSELRKPKPGMLFQARDDLGIDFSSSFLIGDRESDMEAAKAASIPGFLFKGGNLADFVEKLFSEHKISSPPTGI